MARGPTIETPVHQPDDEALGGPGINLAALGGIEDEDRPVRAPSPPRPEPSEELDWAMEEVADDEGSDEEDEEPLPTLLGSSQAHSGVAGFRLKSWVIGGSLVGVSDGVELCVQGLDRHMAFAPHCHAARP